MILGVATSGEEASVRHIAELFGWEVFGWLAYGVVVGYVTYRMLESVDKYQAEILLTLALVTGGYALAQRLQVSGPLAMVPSIAPAACRRRWYRTAPSVTPSSRAISWLLCRLRAKHCTVIRASSLSFTTGGPPLREEAPRPGPICQEGGA